MRGIIEHFTKLVSDLHEFLAQDPTPLRIGLSIVQRVLDARESLMHPQKAGLYSGLPLQGHSHSEQGLPVRSVISGFDRRTRLGSARDALYLWPDSSLSLSV